MPRTITAEEWLAWRSFLRAHATTMAAMDHELRQERGLPLAWYEVLLVLVEAPDQRLRMHDLAERSLFTRSGMTRLVDRMEEAGLVRREACPSDRRGILAVLTPAGRARLRDAAPVHLRGIDQHFLRHLEAGEAEVIGRALSRLVEAPPPPTGSRAASPVTRRTT